jgi:uncharacterized OB-fold protein
MSDFTVNWFRELLNEDHLVGVRCKSCGELMLPPRMICKNCGSTDLEEYEFKGTGKVKTSTTIYVPLTRFQEISPHSVGIVEMDEGVSISGLILSEGKEPKIGEKVEAIFFKNEDQTVLAFKPVQV